MDDTSRIAVLEEKVERIEKKMDVLDEIHQELTRYKGFIGGIVFLATCVFTALGFFKDWLKLKIGV
jgi:hypothetical protein